MVLSSCEGFVSVAQCFRWFLWDICRTPFVWGPWWVAICRRKSPPWPGGKKDPGSEPLPEKPGWEGNLYTLPHDRMRFFFFWQRSSKIIQNPKNRFSEVDSTSRDREFIFEVAGLLIEKELKAFSQVLPGCPGQIRQSKSCRRIEHLFKFPSNKSCFLHRYSIWWAHPERHVFFAGLLAMRATSLWHPRFYREPITLSGLPQLAHW